MKILISADMDGVAGVAVPRQCDMDNVDYELARRLMTDEVNAAVAGAFDAGAAEVLVNDAHSAQINLLPDRMDPRAELILGRPKQGGMFSGLEPGFTGVMGIGFHAGASRHGVLARRDRPQGRVRGHPGERHRLRRDHAVRRLCRQPRRARADAGR